MDQTPDSIGAIASLEEPTRRRLYEFVAASQDAVGRDDAAAGLGIRRELAAFHLDRLADAGLLDVEYRRRSGRTGPGAGRPAKLYRRAPRDVSVSVPARRYQAAAEMLADAIDHAADTWDPAILAGAARERGMRDGAATMTSAGGLLARLDSLGFEPETDPASGAVDLRNCPYRSLSADHRDLICGMNLAWAGGLVDGLQLPDVEPQLMPRPNHCCVVFAPRPAAHDRYDRAPPGRPTLPDDP